MDEESTTGSLDTGETSGEEDVVHTRHPNKSHLILDDESDNSRDATVLSTARQDKTDTMTAEDVLAAVMNDSSSEDEVEKTVLSSLKKKKVKRPVLDDSSDDDENQTLSNLMETAESQSQTNANDREDDNSGTEVEHKNNAEDDNPTMNLPSDLFDAEDSDDPGTRRSDDDRSRSESEKDDEGFDESSIDPKLLAKLKKVLLPKKHAS